MANTAAAIQLCHRHVSVACGVLLAVSRTGGALLSSVPGSSLSSATSQQDTKKRNNKLTDFINVCIYIYIFSYVYINVYAVYVLFVLLRGGFVILTLQRIDLA